MADSVIIHRWPDGTWTLEVRRRSGQRLSVEMEGLSPRASDVTAHTHAFVLCNAHKVDPPEDARGVALIRHVMNTTQKNGLRPADRFAVITKGPQWSPGPARSTVTRRAARVEAHSLLAEHHGRLTVADIVELEKPGELAGLVVQRFRRASRGNIYPDTFVPGIPCHHELVPAVKATPATWAASADVDVEEGDPDVSFSVKPRGDL